MKITAIKAQVKNPERVSIYVDERYAFSLTQAQLLDARLRRGLELDEAKLAELGKLSEFGKAYARILNYVMIRPRSQKEVEKYCWRKKIAAEDCQAIIAKLSRQNLIDDAAFARSWIESRRLTKTSSARKLQMEMRQKGVSDEIIKVALAESEFDEATALQEMIAKKRRLSRYQDTQKLMQYLVRQGFSYDQVRQALETTDATD